MAYSELYKVSTSLFNALKLNKPYILVPYTESIYALMSLLQLFYVKRIYRIHSFMLVELTYLKGTFKINLKFLNVKNKKNYYSLIMLKRLIKLNPFGLLTTSKGVYSLTEAIKHKQGGVLLCLIYYTI